MPERVRQPRLLTQLLILVISAAVIATVWWVLLGMSEGASGEPEVTASVVPSATISPFVPLVPLAPAPSASPVLIGADLNIPWALGGPRYERDGTLRDFPGEWPTVPVQALRLWDTRTAWLNLEPAPDEWDFDRLDRLVLLAESRGVQRITLVLGGTPAWAATSVRDTDAFWLGPGSASPPRELADWTQFVQVVAERYRGRITAYEIWNEPTDQAFWTGTIDQWVDLVTAAASEIRRVDSGARIVAPGIAITSKADLARVQPWLTELAMRGPAITDLSIHFYPHTLDQAGTLRAAVRSLRRSARSLGLPSGIWVTEVNLVGGASLPAKRQRAVIASIFDQAEAAGVRALTWYAWTDLTAPDLMQFQPGTPGARELARQIRLLVSP